MTDPTDDETLLAQFRDWLHQTRAAVDNLTVPEESLPAQAAPEVGLYRLVEEFTALRHEVKLETKGSRGLQEQIEALLPTVQQAIDQFRAVAPKEEQAALAASRPLAEAVADLDEALDRGQREVEKARDRTRTHTAAVDRVAALDAAFAGQPWFRRFGLRAYHDQVRALIESSSQEAESGLLDALLEGYSLIRGRLRRALEAGQIHRIECVGRPVDPDRMTVVEAVTAPDFEPGVVVDEVRRGYTWRGRVLRYAEVRAARAEPVSEEDDPADDFDEITEESE